jgi:hypothetical protein
MQNLNGDNMKDCRAQKHSIARASEMQKRSPLICAQWIISEAATRRGFIFQLLLAFKTKSGGVC